MKCSLGISNFLEESSSLSQSVLFLYFFALIAEEGFLISSCYSLELCIQMLLSFLLCISLLFFSQLFVRPPQTAILFFCIYFPWGWSWSLFPVQCYFANKDLSSQSYGFFSSHVWMWELDYKESWAPKKLEKTLESPLDCKEMQAVHPKGNQSWIFIGRTDAESETPILWPPDAKNWLIGKDPDAGKDWRREEKGMTEDEMVGWHHWLNGHEFE